MSNEISWINIPYFNILITSSDKLIFIIRIEYNIKNGKLRNIPKGNNFIRNPISNLKRIWIVNIHSNTSNVSATFGSANLQYSMTMLSNENRLTF